MAHLNTAEVKHCDAWAVVYGTLQQRTGQTLWSHQYDHSRCPFNDKSDAVAKQAAALHPLQLRPCVLRRPGEPLAPSGSCNVQPQGNAEGVSAPQSVWLRSNHRALRRPREPLPPSESRNVRPQTSTPRMQVQSPSSVPQPAESMHPGDGRERDT